MFLGDKSFRKSIVNFAEFILCGRKNWNSDDVMRKRIVCVVKRS